MRKERAASEGDCLGAQARLSAHEELGAAERHAPYALTRLWGLFGSQLSQLANGAPSLALASSALSCALSNFFSPNPRVSAGGGDEGTAGAHVTA
eukprot:scaffold851_cov122-Isochrysis_galbana.AAC.3